MMTKEQKKNSARKIPPQWAIKIAKANGWPKAYQNGGPKTTSRGAPSDLLDNEFWKALGRGLGWHPTWDKGVDNDDPNHWFQFAHLFFALLMTNGDVERFWRELKK